MRFGGPEDRSTSATRPPACRHGQNGRHRPESVSAAIAEVIRVSDRLDAVVNNAGIGMMGAMGDTTEEELLSVYRTNVVGLHTVGERPIPPHRIQGALDACGQRRWRGRLPFRGVYCSSKAAVELLAEAQSMELARHSQVTVLTPGIFKPRSTTTSSNCGPSGRRHVSGL